MQMKNKTQPKNVLWVGFYFSTATAIELREEREEGKTDTIQIY